MKMTVPRYQEKIKQEGEFWGKVYVTSEPDMRLAKRSLNPSMVWHDPDVERVTRGTYKNRLMNPAFLGRAKVLDIGCGNGWLALELARRGHNVDAFDISEQAIQIAKKYYQRIKENETGIGEVNHQVCDLNLISLPRSHYDFIVCWDSLHHIIEAKRLIEQSYAALKPNGVFALFDHIGQDSKAVNKINHFMSYLALISDPVRLIQALYKRIHSMFRDSKTEIHGDLSNSPFEDVTGSEMIAYFSEIFGSENVKIETTLAFGASWLAKINGPKSFRLSLVRLFKAVDKYLIEHGWVKGEYVFIHALKSTS